MSQLFQYQNMSKQTIDKSSIKSEDFSEVQLSTNYDDIIREIHHAYPHYDIDKVTFMEKNGIRRLCIPIGQQLKKTYYVSMAGYEYMRHQSDSLKSADNGMFIPIYKLQ